MPAIKQSSDAICRSSFTACFATVVGFAGLAMLGWIVDVPLLRSLGQPVPMNPMTSLSLLLTATGLLLLRNPDGVRIANVAGRWCGALVSMTGLLKLLECLTGWQCATDRLLFETMLQGNRMAPQTAFGLTLVGFGLVLLDCRIRGWRVAPALFLGAMAIASGALVGYVYTVLWLYSLRNFNPMALNTAVVFVALCAAGLLVRPDAQPLRGILQNWTLEKKTRVGFAVAILTLATICFTSYRSAVIALGAYQSLDAVTDVDMARDPAIMSAHRMKWASALGGGFALIIVGVAGYLIHRDIRARSRVEQALRASEALTRRVLDSSADGIKVLGVDGGVRSMNRAAFQHLEISDPATCIGADWFSFWEGEHRAAAHRAFAIAREGGTGAFEGFRITGRGAPSWWDIRLTPLVLDGEVEKVVCISRDVTERKKMESELRNAMQMAEAANRAKSEFLAHMSHEIRTPLNGVIGMTDLLLDMGLTGAQRHYAEMVRTSGESLAALLNDILDFSKIEAGKLEIESVRFDLLSTVEDVAEVMANKAQRKGLEIACHAHPDVPRLVVGDPERLRQILVNLINNAVKFTESGSVSIRLAADRGTEAGMLVRFEVTDTGIGIPRDRLVRLFKSFSQVDASTTRKYGGTGLGLAISKQLVELMGGEIGVESELGKGSTFWFTIDFGVLEVAEPTTLATTLNIEGIKVLAVDDNPGSRDALREQIVSWGFKAMTASSGPEALRALDEAAGTGDACRVVLLDDDMPGMSGVDLARAIRSDDRFRDAVTMILLSAKAQVDPAAVRAAGFAGHMAKPVRQSQLFDAIVDAIAIRQSAALVPPRSGTACEPAGSNVSTAHGRRVLLAEDNRVNQIVASGILTKHGYAFDIVDNGRLAVEAMRSGRYDIILMDCQMPELDGFETTREIRRLEAATKTHVPIIALTANAIKGDRERCLAAGMDGYVSKPIKEQRLIDEIERQLTPPSAPHPDQTLVAPSAGKSETSCEGSPTPTEAAPFNVQALVDACMGNIAAATMALKEFERQAAADLEQIPARVRAGDAKGVASSSHALKGAAGMLEAAVVHRLSATMERLARAGDMDGARASIDELSAEIRRCLDYVPEARQILSGRKGANL